MDKSITPILPPRGNGAFYSGIVILALSTLFSYLIYLKDEDCGVAVYLLCVSVLAMFLGELLRRACLLGEEVWHRSQRYNGEWNKLFAKVFSPQKNNYVSNGTLFMVFIFFAALAYYFYDQNKETISAEGGRYFLLLIQNIIFVPIFGFLAGLREPTAVERSEMNEKYNKNLADGLAWSYYFGYLKIILPELEKSVGRSDPVVRDNLMQPVKLFILIPENCYCPAQLCDIDKHITVECNLKKIIASRAGVHSREYHQTLQKITLPAHSLPEGERKYSGEYYCLAEYATPVLTLYEMSRDQNAKLSNDERHNQVRLFFDKLRIILDTDAECKDKYELLFLPDNCNDLALRIVKKIKNPAVGIPCMN